MTQSYKDAGVDLERGKKFVDAIKPIAFDINHENVITPIGGFAGCFSLPTGYNEPVLVASTDGVGTKVLLTIDDPVYNLNVGQDLVAMVVNDLICTGAEPLFFLDYYASSELDPDRATWLFNGMCDALLHCNMSLLGGESAEMPGMYKGKDFDIAGFGVGVVERSEIIDGPKNVKEGDVIIGIESSGPHANGFSLIRKIIEEMAFEGDSTSFDAVLDGVMKPTHLYWPTIEAVKKFVPIKAIANITGGGLLENLPRVIGDDVMCSISASSWEVPAVFWTLMQHKTMSPEEMYSVFNMGVGMTIIVDPQHEQRVLEVISTIGFAAWNIGEIIPRMDASPIIIA